MPVAYDLLYVSEAKGDGIKSRFHDCLVTIDGIELKCKYIVAFLDKRYKAKKPRNRWTIRIAFEDRTVRKHKDYKYVRERLIERIGSIREIRTSWYKDNCGAIV